MANFIPSLFFVLSFLTSVWGTGNLSNGQGKTWCVAKASASETELAENIIYACEQIGDCKIIEEGGSCYNPTTRMNHASVVMNIYYQLKGRNYWNCDFRGTALLAISNPSYSDCQYA